MLGVCCTGTSLYTCLTALTFFLLKLVNILTTSLIRSKIASSGALPALATENPLRNTFKPGCMPGSAFVRFRVVQGNYSSNLAGTYKATAGQWYFQQHVRLTHYNLRKLIGIWVTAVRTGLSVCSHPESSRPPANKQKNKLHANTNALLSDRKQFRGQKPVNCAIYYTKIRHD